MKTWVSLRFFVIDCRIKITGNTPGDGNAKDVEIILQLKYLINFWRTLELSLFNDEELPLINDEVSLILTWSSTCVINNSTGAGTFAITETKLYVPLAVLSTQMQNYCNH